MEGQRFFNIISAITGFGGAVFLLLGVLNLTPEFIATMSEGWGINIAVIENVATQKADFVSGAFLVTVAFFTQMIALLIPMPRPLFVNYAKGLVISLTISVLVLAIFIVVDKRLANRYGEATKRAAAKKYVEAVFRQNHIGSGDMGSIKQIGELLLGMKQSAGQTDKEFARMVADKLAIPIPSGF